MEDRTAINRSYRLWPWLALAAVILLILGYLLGNAIDSKKSNMSESDTITQLAYTAEDVELKEVNGELLAFVGNQAVPYTGVVDGAGGMYVVKDGKVDLNSNGTYESEGIIRLVHEGKLDTTSNGIVPDGIGNWFLVRDGVVETGVTGIRENQFGSWYVKNGRVDFSQSGYITYEGQQYNVDKGKATKLIQTTHVSTTKKFTESEQTTVDPGAFDAETNPDGLMDRETGYVANFETKVFHKDSCYMVKRILPENYESGMTREVLVNRGYRPCEICNP